MALYAVMCRWTDRGVQNVKEAPARIEDFKKAARGFGGEVREVYAALGRFDTMSLVSAPDDEAMTKISLSLAAKGNVHTETLRLFSESEFKAIVGAVVR
jgi:uncharacterized protein with GYD domain